MDLNQNQDCFSYKFRAGVRIILESGEILTVALQETGEIVMEPDPNPANEPQPQPPSSTTSSENLQSQPDEQKSSNETIETPQVKFNKRPKRLRKKPFHLKDFILPKLYIGKSKSRPKRQRKAPSFLKDFIR